MAKLSKNFDQSEFACHCGCRLTLSKGSKIVTALQELRNRIGVPIIIVSGARCAKHNKAVGGAKASQHLAGNAADIMAPGIKQSALLAAVEAMPEFKGIGIEWRGQVRYIHVDCRGYVSRWSYGGKTYTQAKEAINGR
jgi:uncharacterized protein YcbK (DUF882 family)